MTIACGFWICILLWAAVYARAVDRDKQAKLSEVLDKVLKASGLKYPLYDYAPAASSEQQHLGRNSSSLGSSKERKRVVVGRPLSSQMRHLCHSIDDSDGKTGCCMPTDVRHLYNVKIQQGKFVYFRDPSTASGNDTSSSIVLPGVKSVKQQQEVYFKMPVEIVNRLMNPGKDCSSFFEGTLHVIGRGTAKNIYHILGDNFAPLVVQMLLDAFVDMDFLHLPRMHLSGFQPGGGGGGIPHLRLIDDLATGGKVDLAAASGLCFRRVVWGHGAHVLYYDTLMQQRRLMGAFAREFVGTFYRIERPKEYRFSSAEGDSKQQIMLVEEDLGGGGEGEEKEKKRKRPLNIVLYTRGNSGKGRTIQNEELIVSALSRLGAVAVICCDFNTITMEEQIAYSYHADAIMGLHGAALVHGLFAREGGILLELKTLYGYTSILFALVVDARQGVHAQVDIRKYFKPGGHRAVDAALANRTVSVLRSAVTFRGQGRAAYEGLMVVLSAPKQPLDLVMGPSKMTQPLAHIFGPNETAFADACADMLLWSYRDALGVHDKGDLHCVRCAVFR